jgi:hypothetical protein
MGRIPRFPAVFLIAAALLIVGVFAWMKRLGRQLDHTQLAGSLPPSWEQYRATMTAPTFVLVLMAVVVVAFIAAGVYSVRLSRRSSRPVMTDVDRARRPRSIDRPAA